MDRALADGQVANRQTLAWRAAAMRAPPRTLDVGCGTGALLDMKITTPDLYTGIDPSQGMLNELVRKHSEVKDLHPFRVQDVLSTLEPGSFDLVTALFGSASYLTPAAIEHLWRVTGRVIVLMHFAETPGYLDENPLHLDQMLITNGSRGRLPGHWAAGWGSWAGTS